MADSDRPCPSCFRQAVDVLAVQVDSRPPNMNKLSVDVLDLEPAKLCRSQAAVNGNPEGQRAFSRDLSQ